MSFETTSDGNGVRYALFDNRLPNIAELAVVRARGLGLHFSDIPAEHKDWDFFARYAGFLRHLSVIDFEQTDISPLKVLKKLRSLTLVVSQQEEFDLSVWSELTVFEGSISGFSSVLKSRTLSRISLQDVTTATLSHFEGPVRHLALDNVRELTSVPSLQQPLVLKSLAIQGCNRIDLRPLSSTLNLEVLSLDSCRSVSSADVLNELNLRELGLVSCRDIQPVNSLLGVKGCDISVVNTNPFDETFRVLAEASSSNWSYYGTARKGKTAYFAD